MGFCDFICFAQKHGPALCGRGRVCKRCSAALSPLRAVLIGQGEETAKEIAARKAEHLIGQLVQHRRTPFRIPELAFSIVCQRGKVNPAFPPKTSRAPTPGSAF